MQNTRSRIADLEQRRAAIRRIIGERHVSGQEELLSLLKAEGFELTQATLSREMRKMQIAKVPDGADGYRYAVHVGEAPAAPRAGIGTEGVMGIEVSGQIGIVRTRPGYASVVAAAIDEIHLPEVMGTIAGDDTVMLALRIGADEDQLRARLEKIARAR